MNLSGFLKMSNGTRIAKFWLVAVFSLVLVPAYGWAADAGASELNLDMTWVLTAAALVMFMQAGFLLLEAGMVRSKNSINVAQKNLLDFVFSIAAFSCCGFMFAFGASAPFSLGFDFDFLALNNLTVHEAGFFVFQVMFCGTAATIVSGAVAERMRLAAYIGGTIFLSAVIFPVFAHLAWGNALVPNEGALLANIGFIDFAGSTVVHATGGWVSLAACIVLGARAGRFDENGKAVRIAGYSPVLATTGGLLLFIGWIGFNGGSTLKADESVPFIVLNTILAGGFGAAAGHLLSYLQDGYYLPEKSLSGMLGGLVAVTAGCHVLTPAGAIIIGAVGGVVAIYANQLLEEKWKIDDAVGAIGVHGFAGIVGAVGLALLAPAEHFPDGRLHQIYVQVFGALLNFYFCFGLGFVFFKVLNRFFNLRVNAEEENIGLNITEHATRIGVGHVEDALDKLLNGKRDFAQRLPVVAGDEAEKLTAMFNRLMENMEEEHNELKEMEALRIRNEESERIAALSNATFEAIIMHEDGLIVDGNEQVVELLGYELKDLIGQKMDMLLQPESLEKIRKDGTMSQENVSLDEVLLNAKSGEIIPVAVRARNIAFKGKTVRVACFVDLRERRAAERDIIRIAQHDSLTGLANRSLFNERLAQLVASDHGERPFALLLVDLDRFKNVNDVYGHQAGDIVIKEAAERLCAIAGNGAMVARLGGDEFAVILPGIDFSNQAADAGVRIVHEMARPIPLNDGAEALIGASVGIALFPEHAVDDETLFARADMALYHSKNTGRNASNMFRPGLNELMEKRRALEADLDRALERGEFEIYFQPRADANTLEIRGYEALIRWNHPERGLVSPGEFIPVAEACGKIVDIGAWVFRAACLAETGPLRGSHISVNVSPLQFQQRDFVSGIQTILEETGADTSKLELELTESMLLEDDTRGLRVMKMLKSLGLSLALDDFGTGYSSLSYLSKYPFDTIKIDRGFVAALSVEENAVAILKAIIGLGTGLGMKIVAEGVETVEQAVFLQHSGCDQLQGFLLGKPVPSDEVVKKVPEDIVAAVNTLQHHFDLNDLVQVLRQMNDAKWEKAQASA